MGRHLELPGNLERSGKMRVEVIGRRGRLWGGVGSRQNPSTRAA